MERATAKKRIEKLREEIRRHDHLYYVLDKPEISDEAYDKLYKELETLENKYPELVSSDSPTQRIGGEPLKAFKTVTHKPPLLSIDNVNSQKDPGNVDSRVS